MMVFGTGTTSGIVSVLEWRFVDCAVMVDSDEGWLMGDGGGRLCVK